MARRGAAALALGSAGWAAVSAVSPTAPDPGPAVVVAARDLPVGTAISLEHLSVVHLPVETVPDGTFGDPSAIRGVLSAPLRRGEVLTDVRLSAAGTLEGLADGQVLAHVPLADAGIVPMLSAGARVDVLSTVDGQVVAADVLVTHAPTERSGLIVAVSADQASALAVAASPDLPGAGVTVVIRGG